MAFCGFGGATSCPQEPSRRPAAHQSPEESPARSGAYAASLRDTNSVKSRTRFVLRVSPCVRSQSVPYIWSSALGTLASRGSVSPTKHGSVVIPSPCRTAAICASPSVTLNGIPVAPTSRGPNPGFHHCLLRSTGGKQARPHATRLVDRGTCRRRRIARVPSGRED